MSRIRKTEHAGAKMAVVIGAHAKKPKHLQENCVALQERKTFVKNIRPRLRQKQEDSLVRLT